MSVRAVTPQVHALGGGLQFWRDLDGYDLAQDSRWDEIDPGYFGPDPSLEEFHVGTNGRRTHTRVVASTMNALPGHEAGRHGRPGSATSSKASAASLPAGDPGVDLLGGGLSGSTLGQPRTVPSSPVRGSEPQDVKGARRSPGAP